jgi:peptidyl-Asp metalloendopeptidase
MKSFGIHSLVFACILAALAVPAQGSDALFHRADLSAAFAGALALDESFHALADSPATAALEVVQANAALVNESAEALTLNLAPGLDLKAHRVDAYRVESGSLVWSGVIEDPGTLLLPFSVEALRFDPLNTAMLVNNGGKITGTVHFDGALYQIRPLKTGGHAIVEVDAGAIPPEHPPEFNRLRVHRMPIAKGDGLKGLTAEAVGDPIIRVMVHYTPSAASRVGDINGLIDLAVAETNQGYVNSGVAINLVLAHKSQVSYTESGNFSTDLSRYRGTSDGYMDSIHTTRNSVAADVGVIVINNGSYCGLASGIGSTASTAFAAVHYSCATGYYSFGHEIGHLQSARHDPATDPNNSPYSYGHGYRYETSPKWRTIMAYNCSGGCPRLNYWSNPYRTYNGKPMGTTTKSDNTRVLNNTRGTIAGFR